MTSARDKLYRALEDTVWRWLASPGTETTSSACASRLMGVLEEHGCVLWMCPKCKDSVECAGTCCDCLMDFVPVLVLGLPYEDKEVDVRHDKSRCREGRHDWFGACAPSKGAMGLWNKTFSVGIFKWVPRARGGLKRGKVVLRIKGWCSDPQRVYDTAELWCDKLDNGEDPGVKTLSVRR